MSIVLVEIFPPYDGTCWGLALSEWGWSTYPAERVLPSMPELKHLAKGTKAWGLHPVRSPARSWCFHSGD